MDSPCRDNRLWLPIYSPKRNHGLCLLEGWSAVLIQRQFRGFSACKKQESEAASSPSLLDSEESKANDSSVSSLSTSESIWETEKGYHFPEAVTIPSTVAVAKPAIKSNPVVTRSSPRQRQAEPPTVDSPTSSVLSPIKKKRLHVEDSREDVIAVAEKKVCFPEDLLVKTGFKLSVYYTDRPCQVPDCKDPACVFGHTCKCRMHKKWGDVLKGECFSLFKNGLRTSTCLHKLNQDKITAQRMAKVTSTDSFAFFKARTASFLNSTLHSWNNKPSTAQLEVFMLQVVIYQATNPDTPFVVTETSFSDLRNKNEDELEAMLEVLTKRFTKEFPDGKGITSFFSGLEVVPLTHTGDTMLSFHQGIPTLKLDDPGQTWLISSWFMNKYKGGMSPVALNGHMNYICKYYDPDAADAMYECYNGGEDVEVTTASRLFAQSTFAKQSFSHMKFREISSKKRILCGYASAHQVCQHAREMGSICLVMGIPYKEGVMGLSIDRSLDDMHHCPEDCLLIGTRLNDAKATHAAFRTQEALAQHCRENRIDESASNHAKMFRPIIKGMIRRWTKVEAVI